MTPNPSFSPVRRATCAAIAGGNRATAWLVSPRGYFVTSHSAIGYATDLELEYDGRDRKPARVIWVDVARDLVLLHASAGLPRGSEPMAQLPLRDVPAVKIADRVFTVAVVKGRGLCISPASVCLLPRADAQDLIGIDAQLDGPFGGPLLDMDCRAVGLLVRNIPGRASVARPSVSHSTDVLPAAEIRMMLRAVEGSTDPVKRGPVYRCPTCERPFVPEHDACLSCGAAIPHPYPPLPAGPERTIRDILASVGIIANRARNGHRTFHLLPPSVGAVEVEPIALVLTEDCRTAVLRAPVSRIPPAAFEPFYRLLLTLNDQTISPFRLALDGERVVLVLALPLGVLRARDIGKTLALMSENIEHCRKILNEGFDALPLSPLSP